MKTIERKDLVNINGGDWENRFFKQWYKCLKGSERACGRAERIAARHDESPWEI